RSPCARSEFERTLTCSDSRSSRRTWPASTRWTNDPTWHGTPTISREFHPLPASRGRLLPESRIPQRGTAHVRASGKSSTGLARRASPLLRREDGLPCGRELDGPSDRRPGLRADPRASLGDLPAPIPASQERPAHHRRRRRRAGAPALSPAILAGRRLLRSKRLRAPGGDATGSPGLCPRLAEPLLSRSGAGIRFGSGEPRLSDPWRHRREDGAAPRPLVLCLGVRGDSKTSCGPL